MLHSFHARHSRLLTAYDVVWALALRLHEPSPHFGQFLNITRPNRIATAASDVALLGYGVIIIAPNRLFCCCIHSLP
jgi:hypothetical protein